MLKSLFYAKFFHEGDVDTVWSFDWETKGS